MTPNPLHARKATFKHAQRGLFYCCLLACSLPGCSSLEQEKHQTTLSLALPNAPATRSLNNTFALESFVEIVELGIKAPLTQNGDKVVGDVPAIPSGRYTIRVLFDAPNTLYERVRLAISQREITIHPGLNRISLNEDDTIYPDDDGDKYSNVAELLYDTNPFDFKDRPKTPRVFITSQAGTGDLSSWANAAGQSGLAAADAVCQARARAAGLDGQFIAWLSDDDNDAACRVLGLSGSWEQNCGQASPPEGGPWVRMDGFPFIESLREFLSAGVQYAPITYNEFGTSFLYNPHLFQADAGAGSWNGAGTHANNCNNWTTASASSLGGAGSNVQSAFPWTAGFDSSCDTHSSLFCFELPHKSPLPSYKQQGQLAFHTSVSGNGDLSSWPDAEGKIGIEAGDTICQNRAEAGGLPHAERFKAWLTTDDNLAHERIHSNGPWVRPDGVLVAESRIELIQSGVFTGIAVDEYGHYLTELLPDSSGTDDAWLGIPALGDRPSAHCNNWTSSDGALKGYTASTSKAGYYWNNRVSDMPLSDLAAFVDERWSHLPNCSSRLRLICFED